MVSTSILPLKLTDASVRKRGKTILDGISTELPVTGFTMVMGPNGSGKTTLLRLMHGLERPRSGKVLWAGHSEAIRARQAFVFQTPIVLRRTVLDNIAYPLIVRGTQKATAREMAEDWATDVGLGAILSISAHHISGGERQKLAIARALITSPEVIFLDEPTTNLDGQSTKEIEAILVKAYEDGTRIVMTTHDIGQAKRLASHVVFLNNGTLCEEAVASTFFEAPKTAAAQAYLRGDIVE